MRTRPFTVVALSVVLAFASAGSTVAAADGDTSEHDGIMAQLEERFREAHEDLGDEGVVVTWTPWGPVEEPTTGEEMLDRIEQLAARPAGGGGAGNVAHQGAGGDTLASSAWPFCDYLGVFVLHEGEPGDRILYDEVTSREGPSACESYDGETYYRAGALDTSDPVEGWGGIFGVVMSNPDENLGTAGGYAFAHEVGTFQGAASLLSLSFFGVTLDYYVGAQGSVQAGPSALAP